MSISFEAMENELVTSREFQAPRELVFEAWANPEHLSRWWGPKGFTNTFISFDFRPDGEWKFTMHGPNGVNYPNESKFLEIDRPQRIVLLHESNPRFTVTALFEDLVDRTRLTFRQQFESKRDFEIVKSYAGEGNEQNMDRLGELLAKLRE